MIKQPRPLDQTRQPWTYAPCIRCRLILRAISSEQGMTQAEKRAARESLAESHHTDNHRNIACTRCHMPFTQTGPHRTNPSSTLCMHCLTSRVF